MIERITRTVATIVGSRRFALGILGFFSFEAFWVACSAVYPMAFDEDFHFGLIKVYSHYWLPFLSSQPSESIQYGALTRDPSYAYHYLMSFPYRFIELFTHSQTAQVIILRLLNIVFFAIGLVLFYKVLRRAGSSRVLTNTALLVFVLIPIVPLLAGQINYDNLLFAIVAWLCLLVQKINDQLSVRKFDLKTMLLVVLVCMFASIVKYAFLPMAFVAVVFLGVQGVRAFRGHKKQLRQAVGESYHGLSSRTKIVLLTLLVLITSLFAQRYVLNVVTYHTPLPKCDAVLSTDKCMSYSPWARNYAYALSKTTDNDDRLLPFTWTWLQAMHYRLFFMVAGPMNNFTNYPPMPLPSATAVVATIMGITALLCYWRRVFSGHSFLVFLLLISALYCVVVWADNYSAYLMTGQPVAINGRYLLVVILPLAAVFGRALTLVLRQWRALRMGFVLLTILLFLQGGGVFSFILRSDEHWDWPSAVVVHMNNAARRVLAPVTIEGNKYY
ncbi:MAG TPA: hypothetical protein VLH38_01645 [Patescibacteria group bacterium]|nr:hypothetical protein [Patescibacteria group bacterium]